MTKRISAVAMLCMAIPTILSAQVTTVVGPGTQFTNATPADANDAACAAALNTWCARNVRNGGAVGITSANARSGNGSLQFNGPANAKADFEYYFAADGTSGNSIRLGDLTALSFDWFRSSSSTANPWLAPAIRLALFNGSTYQGYLVYEPGLNGTPKNTTFTLPTDSWITQTIDNTGYFWSSREGTQLGYSLTDWKSGRSGSNFSINADTRVVALNVGIGSGWNGSFDGAVDNVGYMKTGDQQMRTFNFETNVVPEPSTYALMSAGLIGLFFASRRRRNG